MYVCMYVHVHCIQVTQLKAFIQSSNPSTPSHSLQRASHHQRSDVSDLALALAGANVWERGSIHLQLRAPPKKKRRKRRVSQLAQTLSKTPSPPFPQWNYEERNYHRKILTHLTNHRLSAARSLTQNQTLLHWLPFQCRLIVLGNERGFRTRWLRLVRVIAVPHPAVMESDILRVCMQCTFLSQAVPSLMVRPLRSARQGERSWTDCGQKLCLLRRVEEKEEEEEEWKKTRTQSISKWLPTPLVGLRCHPQEGQQL